MHWQRKVRCAHSRAELLRWQADDVAGGKRRLLEAGRAQGDPSDGRKCRVPPVQGPASEADVTPRAPASRYERRGDIHIVLTLS